jgi:hypothetical protein
MLYGSCRSDAFVFQAGTDPSVKQHRHKIEKRLREMKPCFNVGRVRIYTWMKWGKHMVVKNNIYSNIVWSIFFNF